MKKILIFIFLLFLNYNNSLAVVKKSAEQTQEKANFIASFFSPEFFINIVLVILVIILGIFFRKIITNKIIKYFEDSGEGMAREELVGVITRVLDVTFLMLGIAIIGGILGIDMGIFMGGLGFGIGFTLKIFLSNFIGGIIMVTQDSYHNGDIIKIGDRIGHIKKINSLFTVVEQFDGVIFYVPNIKFLEEEVENFYANDKRRVEIDVGVDYDTDLVKAKKIILQVLDNFGNILKAPYPSVYITEFQDSAINISVRFWIDSKGEYFVTKSNVTETINLAFKKAGITIPFPQITLSNRNDFKINIGK